MLHPKPTQDKRAVALDIEVWKYDILVGIKEYHTGKELFYWGLDAKEPLQRIVDEKIPIINFNGNHYDLSIIYNYYFNPRNQATPFELSKYIVEDGMKLHMPNDFFNSIDLFELLSPVTKVGLKVIEAILGWEIRETSIDFRYEFKLTEEQKLEAEHYNIQDLDATIELYNKMSGYLILREELADYLKITHNYSTPLPTMMGIGLGAHRQKHDRIDIHEQVLNINLPHPVKQVMIDHMKGNKPGLSHTFEMNGVSYTVGDGGIHSNRDNVIETDVFHVDVKGYYTLLQMLFDLFSRNIPEEGVELIIHMYFERLKMSGSNFSSMPDVLRNMIKTKYPKVYNFIFHETIPLNKPKAGALKIGILSIWGAMRNWHHILYDIDVGFLVTLYGQMFLLQLMDMFGKNGVDILNANTDGLIVKGEEKNIKELTQHWQKLHGFDVEIVKYKRFVAKDVNNYIMGNDRKSLTVKGRDFTAVKGDWMFGNSVAIPQGPVVSKLLTDLLFYGEEMAGDLGLEEYVLKRVKNEIPDVEHFVPMDYMYIARHTMKFSGLVYLETEEVLQRVNRVYASPNGATLFKTKGVIGRQELHPVSVTREVDYRYADTDSEGKPTGRVSRQTIKGYVSEANKLNWEEAEWDMKKSYMDNLSETADGKQLHYKIAEYQYKAPGLPLTKECNGDMSKLTLDDLDLDYQYYADRVIELFLTYHVGK